MNGFPASLYELVQQLGRLDRKGTAIPGENTYEVHVDFNSYVSLYVRIMSCDSADERTIQLEQLHEVLRFPLLPQTCYHVAMENKFEWKNNSDKQECTHYCSKCRGDIKEFTKRVSKAGLQSLLTTKVLGAVDKLSVTDLMKVMKQARKTIFYKDDVPMIGREGQVHRLCLQMMARELIALRVTDNTG